MVSKDYLHTNPTELTEEQLVEAAKSNSSYKINLYNINDRTVVSFLMFYNIMPGSNYISHNLLFNLYKKWSESNIKISQFTKEINKYLIPMGYRKPYYMISLNAFSMNNKLSELESPKMDKTKHKNYKRHFDAFVHYYSLKPGKVRIPGFVLYYLYDKWTYKNNNYNPLGYAQFLNFCKLYFPTFQKIGTSEQDYLVFSVSKSIFENLTKKEMSDIREGHKLRHAQKEKTNKEKRRKVSSVKKTP